MVDEVKFGEVAEAPPQIKAKPRHSERFGTPLPISSPIIEL
jgi:hypothetical protein